MSSTRDMINTHKQTVSEPKKELLIDAIDYCLECGQACVTCSDACLREDKVEMLRKVIRSTADCADVCLTTATALSRLNDPNWEALKNLVKAAVIQTQTCAADCSEHAGMHEHCRICSEACRKCENALSAYLEQIRSK